MANSRVETLLEVQKLRTEILGGEKKNCFKYPFSLINNLGTLGEEANSSVCPPIIWGYCWIMALK